VINKSGTVDKPGVMLARRRGDPVKFKEKKKKKSARKLRVDSLPLLGRSCMSSSIPSDVIQWWSRSAALAATVVYFSVPDLGPRQ